MLFYIRMHFHRIIMWRIIILCIIMYNMIMSLTVTVKSMYDNYKVFQIVPLTYMEGKFLMRMVDNYKGGFSFWEQHEDLILKEPCKLMVAPHMLPEFYRLMNLGGLHYELFINNIQELIDQTTQQSVYSKNITHNLNLFPFIKYPTLDEINVYITNLSLIYKNKIKKVLIGYSSENNEILGVTISFNNNSKNPGIFLEGGIHANEWISPVTVLYILHQLITSTDPDVRALAESHNWYIFPLLNPDGYKYTHTTDRLWKKSRKQYGSFCIGVNLDKNWNYRTSEDLQNSAEEIYMASTCYNNFAGLPFSEPETKALKRYLDDISNKFYAYISFRGSSQLLIFPSLLRSKKNYTELYTIGLKATAALKHRYGTTYSVESVRESVYIYDTGTIIDYIQDVYKKDFVYRYHLRDRIHDFLLPSDQIIPTGQETLDSLISMFKRIDSKK